MAKSRLNQLSELGQSVWIDYLSRHLIRSGELARMMEGDAVELPAADEGSGEVVDPDGLAALR